ncbi:hypothetical protein Slin14017_G098480 [Septoria linicola]|nr:hypothetical protein Slin14017_G098480 [Septoria linicola]
MSAQNDVEMQYKAPHQMSPEAPDDNLSMAQEGCKKEQPKRTILGMRGGGIICE